MQAQTAPVPPVAHPTYTPASGMQSAPNPQQQFAQQLVQIARSLEQAIPGYQILLSTAGDLLQPRAGQIPTGDDSLMQALREATFHHNAALGAIRRFLAGESTSGVVSALSLSVHYLAKTHLQLRPLFERLMMSAPPEQRTPISNLAQMLNTADTLLNQAGHSIQSLVGPQIWQAARSQVFGLAAQPETVAVPQV